MPERVASAAILILLLACASVFMFQVQLARAAGPVYIRADGSVDPPTAPILRNGDYYILTGNVSSDNDGIGIERDNLTLDGSSYTLRGSGTGSGVYVSNRNNVTIKNMRIELYQYGIYLWHCSYSTVADNNVSASTLDGINIWSSLNNAIVGNNASSCENHGIYILEGANNNATGNTCIANKLFGIALATSSNNFLGRNNVSDGSTNGIIISASYNNTLQGNVMKNNEYNFGVLGYLPNDFVQWVDTSNFVNNKPMHYLVNQADITVDSESHPEAGFLALVNCFNITAQGLNLTSNRNGLLIVNTTKSEIVENHIVDNYHGIVLRAAWNNRIYHNDIVNNTSQVDSYSSDNIWDNGYPSGGNYWNDYSGTDLFSGQYQNQTGTDGIGDTRYNATGNNQDRYPLMTPWSPPDIAVTNLSFSKVNVGQAEIVTMNVTLTNLGNKTEETMVIIYADTMIVTSKVVMLSAEETRVLTLVWNTLGFPVGNFTTTAYAFPVPGEKNSTKNTYVNGPLTVTNRLSGGGGSRKYVT